MTNHTHISPGVTPIVPVPNALDSLLRQRFHGAANVRGIRFQLLYFVWRVFDLYRSEGAPDIVLGEGLEDVDLQSIQSGNEYVQVKCLGHAFDWGKMRGVIVSFREVLANDLTARLTLVSNVNFAGEAATLYKHLASRNSAGIKSLPERVREKLIQAIQSSQDAHSRIVTPEEFLGCFRIERLTEEELLGRIYAAIVLHFGVSSGNEELYVLTLFSELAHRSGTRIPVGRKDVDAIRLRVEDYISRGSINPAVRDNFIAPLHFVMEKIQPTPIKSSNLANSRNVADDYFEGRAARPDHIAAGLDVLRPTSIEYIHATLKRASVCAIVASSGQGKSTLAYRYAYNNYSVNTVFIVKVCRDEEDIGQIATYLRSRLRLGLPLLVVIDNIGYHVRLWHKLAAEMANEQIAFLITAREEDWFRYRGNTIGFTYGIVRPQLDFNEACQIYAELRRRNLIATEVHSAQWAFERVQNQRLLIEFVYLLTHGRMLADRLEDQLTILRSSDEDPGKLEALRLVSVAQRYGARITAMALVLHSGFRGDPQQALASLIGEYIVCSEDGVECDGLHPVRSEHLVALLHNPLPVSRTIERIITILDEANLPAFTRNALADPRLEPSTAISLLADRCAIEPPTLLDTIIQACFDAEEQRYFERHRHLFNEAYQEGGDAKVVFLAMLILPRGTVNLLEDLRQIEAARASLDRFAAMADQFAPRVRHERLEFRFLKLILERLDIIQFARDLTVLANLMYWCYDTGIDISVMPSTSEILSASRWQRDIFDLPVAAAATLSFALSRALPEEHRIWTQVNRKQIISFFKLGTCTFKVTEAPLQQDSMSLTIRFPVDFAEGNSMSLNDQAVNRLHILHRLLPNYELYESFGIYLSDENNIMPYDPTHKRFSAESIWQEIDTRKNKAWIRLCRDHYAADTYASWYGIWAEARSEAHSLLCNMYSLYVATLKRQSQKKSTWKSIGLGIETLLHKLVHLPILPGWGEEQERLQKLTGDWQTGITNFLNQFCVHNPHDGQDDKARLMRVNLRNAMYALPRLAQAMDEAVRLSGALPIGGSGLYNLIPEMADYRALVDVFDYWFGPWQLQKNIGNSGLQTPIQEVMQWHQGRVNHAIAMVAQVAENIQNEGISILLPVSIYEEDNQLKSLIVGFEVRDFMSYVDDLLLLLASLGEEGPEVAFIYVAPLLPGRRCFRKEVFRAGKDNAQSLAKGHVPDKMWLFPVEAPQGLLSLLPGVTENVLEELHLITAVLEATLIVAHQQSFQHEAHQHLDPNEPFEHQLLQNLEANNRQLIEQQSLVIETRLQALEAFKPSTESKILWQEFVTQFRVEVTAVHNGIEANTVMPSGSETEGAFYAYLNVAYLNLRP